MAILKITDFGMDNWFNGAFYRSPLKLANFLPRIVNNAHSGSGKVISKSSHAISCVTILSFLGRHYFNISLRSVKDIGENFI